MVMMFLNKKQTITHDHPRIREGRCHLTRKQQPLTNLMQQDERP